MSDGERMPAITMNRLHCHGARIAGFLQYSHKCSWRSLGSASDNWLWAKSKYLQYIPFHHAQSDNVTVGRNAKTLGLSQCDSPNTKLV